MHTNQPTRMFLRTLLLGLALTTPALALKAQTTATTTAEKTTPTETETPPTDGNVVKLEKFEVTVTGSNIKRSEQEKVLPVTQFDHEAITARNALTPVEMLTALPQITNVPRNEASNGGATARGDNANVNLRGIGADNSLILLNGRRLAPHPITSSDNGMLAFSVNVNQLPTQGIERVDVLRDGASSIYGSDAVAGVVNFITQRKYRGAEVRTRFGLPEAGGGESEQGTLTYGADYFGGKLHYMTVLDTFYREAIYFRDRDFTASANHTANLPAPFNTSSAFNGTVTTGYYPSFKLGSSSGSTRYFRPLAADSLPSLTATAPTSTANARDPYYYLDINQYQMGSPRSRRLNWLNAFEYKINDKLTAFADLSFYHASSTLVRQPLAVNSPGSDLYVTLSADNPYNPYGSRFYSTTGAPNSDGTARLTGTPQAIVLLTGVVQGVGPEHVEVNSGLYRLLGGIRGSFGSTWTWESAALYTRAYAKDISKNAVRESLLQAAALRTDSTAYNPFGYTFKVENGAVVADKAYTNPQSVLDTFVTTWRHDGFSSVGSVDFRSSGEIYDLWSGTVSAAIGGEARKEEFIDHRPEYSGLNPSSSGLSTDNNDFITASPKPDSAGERTVLSAYTEVVIPLISEQNGIPLANNVEFTASGRFEHYSDFGNTAKPKIGLNWTPFPGLMIRASLNKGFTAPNLPTLYAPTQYSVDSSPGTTDLYRSYAGASNSTYVQRTYTTGNPDLKPVESTGKSAGIVLDVPKVKGLTLTADYWEIDQRDVISSLSTTQILTSDAALLNAYVQSQLASGKTAAQIDLGSGTSDYKGDPRVVRLAVTADDTADFASTGLPVAGKILSRYRAYLNLAQGFISGWDLSARYNLPRFAIGNITLNTDWSYLIKSYTLMAVPNSIPLYGERVGQDGTTRWRGNATVSWRRRNWNASLSGYYIGPYADSSATTTAALYNSLGQPKYISVVYDNNTYNYRYHVSDCITYNAHVGYNFTNTSSKWLRRSSVRLGVVNLTDKEPPLASGNAGYSTSVYGSLLAGRTWTVELSKQL